MKLFMLSGDHLSLAKSEILALTEGKRHWIDENVLLVDTDKDLSSRLAYTHEIHKFLFKCKKSDFEEQISKFDFNNFYSTNYSVKRTGRSKHTERRLAEKVWRRLDKPKVNLSKPNTVFTFLFTSKKVYCGILEKEIDKSFNKRKAHLRPRLMPIAMNPKLAKCMINLSGINRGKVVDPFCGTGGILIESGLMGFDSIGYDIDERMIGHSKENLKYYGVKNCKLELNDSTKKLPKTSYVVSDLPYGKNTKSQNMEELYFDFLKLVKKKSVKCTVVSFPDNVDYKKIIRETKLKIKKEFTYFVHKSMNKKIVIISS